MNNSGADEIGPQPPGLRRRPPGPPRQGHAGRGRTRDLDSPRLRAGGSGREPGVWGFRAPPPPLPGFSS
ncbi:hypothetical protein P7K49_032772 [Saguinus oedipus]|uniref:Uncharacterized protein n=1 Tax=Saguinus oedipus TaxID=9490 RepID=A0ABQ9TQQ7_SAGOE|nr:hypothetical protein P7K49_032772 [Saguinus oedipus]